MHKDLIKYPPERITLVDPKTIDFDLLPLKYFKKRGVKVVEDTYENLAELIPYFPKWANYVYLMDESTLHMTKKPIPLDNWHDDEDDDALLMSAEGVTYWGNVHGLECNALKDKRGMSMELGSVWNVPDFPADQAVDNALIWMRSAHVNAVHRTWWNHRTFKELVCQPQ